MSNHTEPAYTYRAVVRSIYDGDTIRLDVDLGFSTWITNMIVRLAGIDAPEIRGEERPLGLEAKAWLEARIPPGTVLIVQTDKDRAGKYGRYLGTLWLHGEASSVNDQMVEAGKAERYG